MSYLHELNRLRQLQSGGTDPILFIPGLVGYWNSDSIDEEAIAESSSISLWNDVTGNGHTANENGGSPLLHYDSVTGKRQIFFNNSGNLLVGTNSAYDFVPGTDEFFILFQMGEIISLDAGCLVCKSEGGVTFRQYQVALDAADPPTFSFYLGGATAFTAESISTRSVVIMNIGTANYNVWVDNAHVRTDVALPGVLTSIYPLRFGGRGSAGGFNPTAQMERVAIGSGLLTTQEITDIFTFHQYN